MSKMHTCRCQMACHLVVDVCCKHLKCCLYICGIQSRGFYVRETLQPDAILSLQCTSSTAD